MAKGVTIGLDLAKNVFQAHGADAEGNIVFRKLLRRYSVVRFFAGQHSCMVAMEAVCICALLEPGTATNDGAHPLQTSVDFWACPDCHKPNVWVCISENAKYLIREGLPNSLAPLKVEQHF